jgi:hypothetical protein
MRTFRPLILLSAILMTIGLTSQAQEKQEARLYGNVRKLSATDSQEKRLEITIIPECKCSQCSDPTKCDCCPDQVTTTTDEQGHYDLKLSPGTYTMEVGNTKTKVTLKAGEEKTQNIEIP